MELNKAQRRVISNIFRDLTKLTVIALVVGQFVPGQIFDLIVFVGGVGSATLMAITAVIFAANEKEDED